MSRLAQRVCTLLVCLVCLLADAPAFSADAGDALTLDDYFAAALQRSEIVATQVESIHQAEERYQQASAALYPTVEGLASYTRQESVTNLTVNGTTIPSRQPLVRLNATQPLFRGFH